MLPGVTSPRIRKRTPTRKAKLGLPMIGAGGIRHRERLEVFGSGKVATRSYVVAGPLCVSLGHGTELAVTWVDRGRLHRLGP
jgi:hypothetical protein